MRGNTFWARGRAPRLMVSGIGRVGLTLALVFMVASTAWGQDRSGKYPGWLPADETSPFFPDDAFSIQTADFQQKAHLRKTFNLTETPRRAVLAATGQQMVGALLNGKIVLENFAADPAKITRFVDVTAQLQEGANVLELRSYSSWSVLAYAQLRVEHTDGTFEDILTDSTWEWHTAPETGWPRVDAPAEGWQPVTVFDDYYGAQGRATMWDKEFALMPRDMLEERMETYCAPLRNAWTTDRLVLKPAFSGSYTSPEYAAQYGGFLRVNPEDGQIVDATGKVRHLFFSLYGQVLGGGTTLSIWGMDFDRLEEDLALMEQSGVHPYLRILGWHDILDKDGNWRLLTSQPVGTNLPAFTYNYEVLDYFLDRCQAHGRYVAIECDFFWGAHWDTLPAVYHKRYHLYPEVVEASALAHRKILTRYSQSPCVSLYMIGEEDIIMDRDLENGHARKGFAEHLQSKYGSLDALRQAWKVGYDFTDTSAWWNGPNTPSYWGAGQTDNPTENVNYPLYALKTDPWAAVTDWSQIGLPVWPQFRASDPPHAELYSHLYFMDSTDDDPMWIDYNAFLQDELYLGFVSQWATTVRDAAPNQLLFHCNPQDYTAQWLFFDFHRQAELPFDIIGTGSHDTGANLADLPPWDRLRKYYTVVASYRPYALAQASPATGIASGEGDGGRPNDEQGALDYYRAQSMEMVGHGATLELSYSWPHLSGADFAPDGRGHVTPAMEWMGAFYREVDGKKFSLPRRVDVLVVRNSNLQWSNRSGRDYGNAVGLVDHLGRLNVEFDIAMDRDLVYGRQDRKIDLSGYSVVFLPSIECDYPEEFWAALDAWLSDAAAQGTRTLVLGYVAKRSPYLAPTQQFHPTLARWLGTSDYAATAYLENQNAFTWQPLLAGAAPRAVTLNLGNRDITETGIFEVGAPLLTASDGRAVAVSLEYAGNRVCAFGFPLGMAFDFLWGMAQAQEPYDVLASVYEDILDAAGTPRPVRVPHNVRAALSDDGTRLLLRETQGLASIATIRVQLPAQGGQPPRDVELPVTLGPYGGRTLTEEDLLPNPDRLSASTAWTVGLGASALLVLGFLSITGRWVETRAQE